MLRKPFSAEDLATVLNDLLGKEVTLGRYYLHRRDFKGDLLDDKRRLCTSEPRRRQRGSPACDAPLVGDAVKQGHEPASEAVVIADEHGRHLVAVPIVAALPSKILGLLTQPDKVLPAHRFTEYRGNAEECRAHAENTDDPDDKSSWLKLADAWLQMLPATRSPSGEVPGWPKASDEHSNASH
jgi:hypothetical protein